LCGLNRKDYLSGKVIALFLDVNQSPVYGIILREAVLRGRFYKRYFVFMISISKDKWLGIVGVLGKLSESKLIRSG
jgi:hypothetical protein